MYRHIHKTLNLLPVDTLNNKAARTGNQRPANNMCTDDKTDCVGDEGGVNSSSGHKGGEPAAPAKASTTYTHDTPLYLVNSPDYSDNGSSSDAKARRASLNSGSHSSDANVHHAYGTPPHTSALISSSTGPISHSPSKPLRQNPPNAYTSTKITPGPIRKDEMAAWRARVDSGDMKRIFWEGYDRTYVCTDGMHQLKRRRKSKK
ncbi:hypothetical protein BJ508DRAFT_330332 [Ascobolus immersus RN42]|uniref:Uncharacterized protein n=1 Tax=Ascobolus immersus RN42 TaxID=1160509 RepID=A0A3N4HTP4_ASCIM|nr:hypothetical protein BJ508DRAFT_330332 [Ascobolus immersus RN42]